MTLRHASLLGLLALLLAPLNGCLFGTSLRGARSLGLGQRSLTSSLNYWSLDSSQVETGGHPRSQDQRSHMFDSAAEFRMGTRVPGLDMGLDLNIPSGVGANFKYQFLGFSHNPDSLAAAAGLEFNADWLSGLGVAGTLSAAHDIGLGDLTLGGRLGRVTHDRDPQVYEDRRNNSYYFNKGYSADPDNYSYADAYASLELRVLKRMGILFGVLYRQYVGDTSFGNVQGPNRMDTSFPGMLLASVGIKSYGGRMGDLDAAPTVKKRIEEGRGLAKQGKYAEAIELLLPALENAPEDRDLLITLAFCHYKLGRMSKALGYYEEALKGEPDNARLQKTVEDIRKKMGTGEMPDKDDEEFMP